VGISVLLFGIFYWAVWRILLPKLGKYELVSEKETLKDGTVVTIVRVDLNAFKAPLMFSL
jgi:hypothetical protein